jgi:hypothetical protein
VLTAANANLLTNAPPVFSGTATRDAAFDGAGEKTLAEGQLCYLEDSNIVQYYDGATWASVSSTAPTSRIRLHTHNGYGSSSTMIPRFATTVVNSGSDITYADSATLGSTFTINTAGMYAIGHWHGGATSGSTFCGISLNSAQLATAIYNITASNRLVQSFDTAPSGGTEVLFAGSTFYFAVGDVIRPHTNAETPGVAAHVGFSIARVN